MDAERLEHHLLSPQGRDRLPRGGPVGVAGGAAAGMSRASASGSSSIASPTPGFDARGCGATIAAGSAAVALVRGRPLLDAARIGAGRSRPSSAG